MEKSAAAVNRLKPNRLREHEKSFARWERLRKTDAVLQLAPMRDLLDWLLAGEPDPESSLDYFDLCSDQTDATEVGRYLLEFGKKHPFAFLHSGWVRAVVGRVVLEDENATRQFIKAYWKQARPAKSRDRAYQALRLVQGEHQRHWSSAASWMQNFRKQQHTPRESDSRFVGRAIEAYSRDKSQKPCNCVDNESLKKIAVTVLDNPEAPPSAVVDYALAKVAEISHGTLTHLRAKINRRLLQTVAVSSFQSCNSSTKNTKVH